MFPFFLYRQGNTIFGYQHVIMKNVLIFCLFFLSYTGLYAQSADNIPGNEPLKLSGPRFGATYIRPGELANELKNEYGAEPLITQFGWQFETQYFVLPNGVSGLVEFIGLIGGLEQNLFLPSLTFLVGIRGKNGLELGFGPNLSLAGAAFVFAAGANYRVGQLNIPVNLAFVPSTKGSRISLLIGFNARKT